MIIDCVSGGRNQNGEKWFHDLKDNSEGTSESSGEKDTFRCIKVVWCQIQLK